MHKFCTKCGSKLDESTGNCPVCNRELSKKELKAQKKAAKKAEKKALKKEKWKKLSFKEKFKKISIRFLICFLILVLLVSGITVTLVYFNIVKVPFVSSILNFFGVSKNAEAVVPDAEVSEQYIAEVDKKLEEINNQLANMNNSSQLEPIDTDEYFRNNSTVINEVAVNSSPNIRTEADAYNNFASRGFGDGTIEALYSMNGDFSGAIEVSATSQTKHPYYQTYYTTDNNNMWIITEINGFIMANPVSYNMQYQPNVQVMLSETDTVTSYDSTKNKFYETIPNESELIVKTVSRIDAETLNNLSFGDINAL